MTPELKEEILGSESFEDFCSKNVLNCDEIILRTAIVADKFYTVKMEAEKAKVEKLKETLKFYAKLESWKNINQYSKSKITKDDEERIGLQYFIGGRIARQTLKEIEGYE